MGPAHRLAGTIGNVILVVGLVLWVLVLILGDGGSVGSSPNGLIGRYGD